MTITVNGKEIDSTDSKTIAREIAKTRRAEKKQFEVGMNNRKLAAQHAMVAGYRILAAKASGEFSHHWELERVGVTSHYVKVAESLGWKTDYSVETINGTAVIASTSALSLRGAVIDGAGFCLAVSYCDPATGKSEMSAIGVQDDQWSMMPLPGVTIEDFAAIERRD